MSDKATCPSCEAHLSSIFEAFRDGGSCPNCGLPAAVAAEVEAARERYRDDQRTEELTTAITARGKAEAERDDALRELRRVKASVEQLQRQIEAALRPLEEKRREERGW